MVLVVVTCFPHESCISRGCNGQDPSEHPSFVEQSSSMYPCSLPSSMNQCSPLRAPHDTRAPITTSRPHKRPRTNPRPSHTHTQDVVEDCHRRGLLTWTRQPKPQPVDFHVSGRHFQTFTSTLTSTRAQEWDAYRQHAARAPLAAQWASVKRVQLVFVCFFTVFSIPHVS